MFSWAHNGGCWNIWSTLTNSLWMRKQGRFWWMAETCTVNRCTAKLSRIYTSLVEMHCWLWLCWYCVYRVLALFLIQLWFGSPSPFMRSNTLCHLSLLQIWKLTQRCIRLATQIKSIASNVNFSKSTPPYSFDMTPSWLALWWGLWSDLVSCCLRFLYRLNLFLPQKYLFWSRFNQFLVLLSTFWRTSTWRLVRLWSFDIDVHYSILYLPPSLSTFRTFFTSFTWSLSVKRRRFIFIFNICDIIANHFR